MLIAIAVTGIILGQIINAKAVLRPVPPNSKWCSGNSAYQCNSTGCSQTSIDCGASGCVGSDWHTRGCSNGSCYDNVLPNDSRCCECSSRGWYDAPFWGGCSDCTSNSTNSCTPCGEALAYCDGCNWNNNWNPFRDETYTGTSGHKCPGSAKICTPNSKWCSGSNLYSCASTGCSQSFVENCNGEDGCVGATYQDWYCSVNKCDHTDYPNSPICNQAPSVPTLLEPPNATWEYYNPTFKAISTDPNNDKVRIYFNVLGYGDAWSGWANSGERIEWGPINLSKCFNNYWRAYAQDINGSNSNWSGYFQALIDKGNPTNNISYPTGDYAAAERIISKSRKSLKM